MRCKGGDVQAERKYFSGTILAWILKPFPIILHESAGVSVDCSRLHRVTGNDPELICNECGAVVGVEQVGRDSAGSSFADPGRSG